MATRRTYLDNASTTFPKPPCVTEAVCRYMTEMGTNVGRGEYASAFDTEDLVSDVVFTRHGTEALNLVLKGFLHPGDQVIVSSMEHNAVMRPLTQLAAAGVTFSRAQCAPEGTLDAAEVERLICTQTRAVVMTHASNVCGTILPVCEVGAICRRHGIPLVIDAAQTAGVVPISMEECGAAAICFTGHKGLLGPQGIGGCVLDPEFATQIDALVAGGTGSHSDSEQMPPFMPDRLEAGTPNLPGIAGLAASLAWLGEKGIDAVRGHELALTQRLLDGLRPLAAARRVRLAGLPGTEGRTGVVSIQTPGYDLSQVAHDLDARFGIQTRVGLHCAPSAHKTLGTFPAGTIRFSLGWANNEADVDLAISALGELLA